MSVTDTHVIGDYAAATTIDSTTHYLLIQPGNASTAYNKINRNVFLGVSGQPVDISTAQTLTNKVIGNTNTVTIKDTLFTLQDDGDTTKQARFQLSGITTATTRTYTLPNASSTLVDISTAQTLTNKTLTSPVITGGSIDNTTITVDTIAGHTASTTGSIYGISVASGAIQSSIAIGDGIILPKALFTGTGSSWVWQAWTPTWVNVTVGNGSVTAKYTQIGKTIFAKLVFVLGSTSTIGTSPTFTLPVVAASFNFTRNIIGGFSAYDQSASYASARGDVRLDSATTAQAVLNLVSGSRIAVDPITATAPFTWTTTDEYVAVFSYEAA